MLTRQRFVALSLLTVVAIGRAMAQDAQTRVDRAATLLVTAAASGSDMRFTAPAAVVQMRLEVFSPEGEKVFDSGDKSGNVLDWRVREQQGVLRADTSYLCMVTVRDLSGRLSQRHGLISSSAVGVTLRTAERDHLTPAQVQAWEASRLAQSLEPVAQDGDTLAILLEGTTPALTLMAHDGTDGQVTRTLGAISFRFGDFFSGKDTEQMRLTEEGNLGIGTAKPKVKLDVVGTISAREGLMFADGSTLNVSDKGVLTRTTASGEAVPNIAGTGTQNRLAKWLETGGSGTLGDSTVTESNGRVGIGTANPGGQLHIFGAAVQDVFAGMGPDLLAGPSLNYGYAGASFGRGAGFFNVRPDANATPPNPSLRFLTLNQQRMIVTNVGNVGIGTTAPAHRLDVAGDINTTTQYNIGGSRALGMGSENTFVGRNAGVANTGFDNSFFGEDAGRANTTANFNSFFGYQAGSKVITGGDNAFFGAEAGENNTAAGNAFFGRRAGRANTLGNANSFFGFEAGLANITGISNSFFGIAAGAGNISGNGNSFFGRSAGVKNTVGRFNSFFGSDVGDKNTTGESNSFFGNNAGAGNISGNSNSFFGAGAGSANTTGENNVFVGVGSGSNVSGNNNTLLGSGAKVGLIDLTNATAIGAEAQVDTSNSLVLGTSNVNVGIGTGAPTHRLTVGAPELPEVPTAVLGVFNAGPAFSIVRDTTNNVEALVGAENGHAIYGSVTNHDMQFRTNNLARLTVLSNGNVGIGTTSPDAKLQVNGTIIFNPGAGGNDLDVCRNNVTFELNICGSSSIRYKRDVRGFTTGLDLLSRLRPVSFRWKQGGHADFGLIAEEVERVEPLLVTRNVKGEVEGVKYDRLGVVLLNAVQEQQAQIKEQQQQLRAKDARIADLEKRLGRYDARLASLERSVRRTERMARRGVASHEPTAGGDEVVHLKRRHAAWTSQP